MKLRAKFILAFLIIVLFIAVVGRINTRLGSQAIRTYDAIVDEFVPVVIGLGNVKAALLRVQREIYSNILIENESEVFQLANQRQKKWQDDYFLRSEKPEDKQIVYEVNKTETAVYQLGIDLIQEKKKGSQIGLKQTKEHLDQAADRLNKIVNTAIEQRINGLQAGARIAGAVGDRTLSMAYVIVIASVLFAIVVGFLLARSVLVPIQQLKDAAEKLGTGDLSSRVKVHSKDEMGVLAETFNRMAENMDQSSRRLQLARDEAERANRLKSEFMRNTSHELRTPMAIIMGMNDLVLDAELSGEQKECALAIRKASQNLSHLINDMLDFSKGSYGQLSLKAVPFDLYKACEKVINVAINEARGKGLELTLRYADRTPRQVVGDPGRIIQILTILLNNAVKFTEKGQVRLEVDGRQDKVGEALFFFSVVDTGIGIAKENLGHIFEELTQIDGSTTRRYGGLGLGLSICTQLVQLIKGKLTAESELGKGSVFRVQAILPLAVPHQEGSGEAKTTVKHALLISVLLWDPVDADQRLEKRMLEELGCSVDAAPTMEDAVKMLRESPYDAFFMARPAGELEWIRQYIEQCKMGSLSRNLSIIGMITDSRAEEREFNLELTSLLKKPITYKDFEKILENLV